MTVRNRVARLVVLTAAATALLLPGASLAQAKTPTGPAGPAFYKAPAKLIAGTPGTIIWTRQIPYSATGKVALAASSKTLLVLYRSRDVNNKPIAVSGTIDIPKGKAPSGGWKMLSWAHGTTGIADVCAPSLTTPGPADALPRYSTEVANSWVEAGYMLLRTDYPGLGTPGPHPYLIGKSEGRSVIDIALAARSMIPAISKNWAILGHSQGGQAALFAASMAPKIAPALKLKGVVAYAPASHLYEQRALIADLGPAAKGITGLAVTILLSAAREAGINPADLVTDPIAALIPQTEKTCTPQLGAADMFGAYAPNEILKPNVVTTKLDAVLKAMNPNVKIAAPISILQGKSDLTVFPWFTDDLAAELTKSGDQVTYEKYDGLNHGGVVMDLTTRRAVAGFLTKYLGAGR